jgi:tetratricopeptide (TPR) repeat protein
MIARNCAEELCACLTSYAKYPDEVVIVNTGIDENEEGFKEVNQVAEKFGAELFHFPWVNDFSKARNFSFGKCTNDVVMWLDSDDVIPDQCAERMDFHIRQAFARPDVNAMMVDYFYEWDDHGSCTTRLLRERIVDRRMFQWKAPIHECLCADFALNILKMPTEVGVVNHVRKRSEEEHVKKNLRRNLETFEKAFPNGNAEPRMNFYWGNTLMGLGRYEEAIDKYESYLDRVEVADAEKYVALCSASESARLAKNFQKARELAAAAISMDSRTPSGYLQMAEQYVASHDWNRAVVFSDEVLSHVQNAGAEMVCNPKALRARPLFIKAISLSQLGDVAGSKKAAQEALKWYPDDNEVTTVLKQVEAAEKATGVLSSFIALRDYYDSMGDREGLSYFASRIPGEIANHNEVQRVIVKERGGDKKRIAFFCALGPQASWGPNSISKGVGGSEEATINMSRLFAKKGWHVEVYCYLGEKGPVEKDGVFWYDGSQWSGERDDPFDVTVFWRAPGAPMVHGAHSKTNYLWLHDIYVMQQWQYGLWEYYDGVMCLSKYHRELYKIIPEDKVMYTSNAMDPALFLPEEQLTNEPHRMVYGSCPTRGLESVLKFWPMIRESVPDATLDVYYGWTEHTLKTMQTVKDPRSDWLCQAKVRIDAIQDQPGVTWHGMVDQMELSKAYARSGVWGYPTTFPEISCITAMKIQAHGCWPVTTTFGALNETVRHGVKIDRVMDTDDAQRFWATEAIKAMLYPPSKEQRMAMAREARKWIWESVADQWEERFLQDLAKAEDPLPLGRGDSMRLVSRSQARQELKMQAASAS